ncbi:Alpha/Beta hydrolase protein [Xylariaceae sp. FL0594]|nr:Alpha/Beta hydrolase protein [Xylariaceae sp. FL0594]
MKGIEGRVSSPATPIKREAVTHLEPLTLPCVPSWRGRVSRYIRDRAYILVLLAFVVFSSLALRQHVQERRYSDIRDDRQVPDHGDMWTEWLDITPSEKLGWQPCFKIYGPNLQCARLTVPMDYTRPLNESARNPKVHLALVMVPGAGRTEDPSSYAETPLLINPGGPGASGAVLAEVEAQGLQLLLGGQQDIIGFDPRGVGASTPKADCFVSKVDPDGLYGRKVAFADRLAWVTTGHDVGLVNSSHVALAKQNARSQALAQLCRRVDESKGDDSIFRHMSTPNSARDMLSIIHAWDEWRSGGGEDQDAMHAMQLDNTKEERSTSLRRKLVYWGFSYGTLLGATFASMFPDRVGRMVLDGVVHADYYVEPTWQRSVVDADAIWDEFFNHCADKGFACDFYRAGDSPDAIKQRFHRLLASLEEQPAIALPPGRNMPSLITASDVKKTVFFAGLYAPIVGFPAIAKLLDYILTDRIGSLLPDTGTMAVCGDLTLPVWPDDAMKAIACGDKRRRLKEDPAALQRRFEKAAPYSWFADVWFGTDPALGCNGWEIEPKDPPMRWGRNSSDERTPIKTHFPILFMSNTLDPVTPLDHALDMTRKFANASIIEQDAIGHCSASCVSSCTIAHIRGYINDGVVPPPPKFKPGSRNEGEWPTCGCSEEPWAPPSFAMEESMSESSVTTSHMEAYREMRDHIQALTLSQLLDHTNPLKSYLLGRGMLAGSSL